MTRTFSIFSTVLGFSTIHMMIVQWPLMARTLHMVDATTSNGIMAIIMIMAVQLCLFAALMGLLSLVSLWVMRVVAGIILIVDVVALYFMLNYGILLNQEMIANILHTSTGEVGGLIDWRIFVWAAVVGGLPAIFLLWVKITPHPYWRRLFVAPLALGALAVLIMLSPKTEQWINRNGLELGGRILPWSYIANTVRYYDQDHARQMRAHVILPDSTSTARPSGLVILAIGESARSDNFAYYGYARDTNPYTPAQGYQALPPSHACATQTIGGVACILARRGRAERDGDPEEPLPSYIRRHGIFTQVSANNTGLPRISVDRFLVGSQLVDICEGGLCADRLDGMCMAGVCNDIFPDGILLAGLPDLAKRALSEPVFLVLHLGGSHGPNYFEKYPHAYNVFEPICTDKMLSQCDVETVRNVYDNSLIYTDHVLAEIAAQLERVDGLDAVVLYTSDHGESLGEEGMYLHSAPVETAPDVQLNVPFLVWQSPSWTRPIRNLTVPAQDAMFHTVLGAFGLTDGGVYLAERDIFGQTR